MKILCSKDILQTGVNTVQRAVSNKSTLPVLQGILLKAEKQTLTFCATDLEIGIRCEVAAEITEEGSTVVPAKLFSEIVRKLPDTIISLDLNDDVLIIKYFQAEISLKNYDPQEFPLLPDLDDARFFTLPTALLKNMIRQTAFACATEETRPIFTGVLLNIDGHTIKMVGTDTHRLAYRIAEIPNQDELQFNGLIPSKTLSEIYKLIRDEDEFVNINFSDSQISFQFGSINMISRLIDGQFPNYNQVIPKSCDTKIYVSVDSLLDSVERAALIARDNSYANIIRLAISNRILKINKVTEIGKINEKLDIKMEGKDTLISFNAKFLIDVLKIIDCEDIVMEFSGSFSPGIIRPLNDSNYLYLLLPVRAT
ncbi:MAG: DNA polymerase III subunit beta [Desulfitobacteriaceae bacterium]|nr:DNA polymerase III subunit beta [Desulfitobacteriaceae bacterium]MDD4345339.1 DNA polymerase III subunit beta [Desulfitobacteriaceae bacterium]MDD4400338.1 DNA polymerase III subunit beta [Desulfitobacteriaceae bacterium]